MGIEAWSLAVAVVALIGVVRREVIEYRKRRGATGVKAKSQYHDPHLPPNLMLTITVKNKLGEPVEIVRVRRAVRERRPRLWSRGADRYQDAPEFDNVLPKTVDAVSTATLMTLMSTASSKPTYWRFHLHVDGHGDCPVKAPNRWTHRWHHRPPQV